MHLTGLQNKIMADSCFICTTPYQLIASIAIASTSGERSDLYIVPQFTGARDCSEKILRENIFSKVNLTDTSRFETYKRRTNRLLYGAGIISNYLMVDKIAKEVVGNAQYKKIYISSQANVGRLVSLYFLKHGAEIVYFDDGEDVNVYKILITKMELL